MKKYIMIVIAVFAAMTINAQQVLTLDECRQLALQNNVAIKNAGLNTGVAKAVRQEAFTKYFPEVSATGVGFMANHHILQYDMKGEIPLPQIPEILPDGGVLPYNFNLGLIKKGIMAGVNLVEPVYTGGLIVNGNKLAEVGEAVAELQSRQSADQVRLTVEQYYWQLASLKAKRETVNKVIALLDTLEQQVNIAVDAGVFLQNDLLEVQLQRNEMQTARMELDNGISIVSMLLGQYIGKGVEPIDIDADINPDTIVTGPDGLFIAPVDAVTNTTIHKLLDEGVKAAELSKKIAFGENLPKVGVGAGYFYNNILDQSHGFGAIYATVAIPISGWWGGSHSVKQAKLRAQMALNERDDASELLQVKMTNAWNALNTSYDKIGVARLSVAQSTENMRLNEVYYHAGTTTISDLLKAQSLFKKSCDQFVDAYGDYQIKTIEYLQSTGR